jgi:hypothetical protein
VGCLNELSGVGEEYGYAGQLLTIAAELSG